MFNLGPIYSEGVRTGYGAICGLHSNSEDAPGIYCRKALTIGDLSEEDCRLRLKRWLLAGLKDDDWPEDQARSRHLSLGGLRLVDFSVGDPESVLDRQVVAGKAAVSKDGWVSAQHAVLVFKSQNCAKRYYFPNSRKFLFIRDTIFQEFVKQKSTISKFCANNCGTFCSDHPYKPFVEETFLFFIYNCFCY